MTVKLSALRQAHEDGRNSVVANGHERQHKNTPGT